MNEMKLNVKLNKKRIWVGGWVNWLATGVAIVDVFGADLSQSADELVERLSVNHQTADAFGIVGDDVGRPYVFPARLEHRK
jgi:hypothetical protein